jgi:hypothetical protein
MVPDPFTEWIHTKATKNVLGFGPCCLTETWSL